MRNIFILHSKAMDGEADGLYLSKAPTSSQGFLSPFIIHLSLPEIPWRPVALLPPHILLLWPALWPFPQPRQESCPRILGIVSLNGVRNTVQVTANLFLVLDVQKLSLSPLVPWPRLAPALRLQQDLLPPLDSPPHTIISHKSTDR